MADTSKIKLKKFKTRELTKNEKFLLSLLAVVLFLWLVFKFVLTPQIDKLNSLREQKIEYQEKIVAINEILRRENEIKNEWEELSREKEKIVSRYFPTLDQAQIIYLLNTLMDGENISTQDYNFSRRDFEDFGDFQVRNMTVSIPYSGNYDGIIGLINRLKGSPRRILLDNITVDRSEDEKLNGNIALKIYSLEGIAESDKNVVYIEIAEGNKDTPFSSYEDFQKDNVIGDESQVEVKPYVEEILLDFEVRNNYFLPSHSLVKGNVSLSQTAKSKKYSLRLEYNIVAIKDENRAYIDISKNNITLKYPPNTIGLWIHSYDYSPATIGIGLKGQMGEEIFLPFTEGIGWTGWKYVELSPPTDISIYPLKLDKLYLELPKDRDDMGVVLLDKLESVYIRNLDEKGNDASLSADYIFHEVQPGETVYSISRKYYGTGSYSNEILRLNDMKSGDVLSVGKILVLRKR